MSNLLEVENIEDFLVEMKEDNIIRVAELQTAMQGDKGEPMIGMIVVLTSKVNDDVIKYVESIGTADQKNEKDIKDLIAKKDNSRKEIKKKISDRGIAFTNGMWSNG